MLSGRIWKMNKKKKLFIPFVQSTDMQENVTSTFFCTIEGHQVVFHNNRDINNF